jgi:hypothetical protein
MERRHEPTRLEGFSDAVFGFALTLLVVSLEVPRNSGELIELMRGFLPFALMFAMICWIWYEHQQFFRNYGLQGPWVITVNCLLLFVVLFSVYPLKYLTISLIGPMVGMVDPMTKEPLHLGMDNGDTVMLLYSTGVVLIFGAFVLLYREAWKQRAAMGLGAEESLQLKSNMRGHFISAGLGVVSIVLVLIARATQEYRLVIAAGLIYSLMGPLHGWNGHATGKSLAALRKKSADAQR